MKVLCSPWIYCCVYSVIGRGGRANVGESPGLNCCYTSPPTREILTFPAQRTLCPAFLSGGMKPMGLNKDSSTPAFSSSSVCPLSVLASGYGWRGRGAYSFGTQVIWHESSRQTVCAVPPICTLTFEKTETRCKQHCWGPLRTWPAPVSSECECGTVDCPMLHTMYWSQLPSVPVIN